MGSESVKAVNADEGLTLVAQLDAGDDLVSSIKETQADVVVDFTQPDSALSNTLAILNAGARPVVGTTGFTDENLNQIDTLSKEKGLASMIVPNFAIGAVLMMQFAKEASKHLPDVEIIEYHHPGKKDSPSGTAVKTAEVIMESNPNVNPDLESLKSTELIEGARGGAKGRVPIHSVRLPGYVASQEVVFGGLGQTLTLRHDTIHRESFMPGVVLACSKATSLAPGLTYGLEHVL